MPTYVGVAFFFLGFRSEVSDSVSQEKRCSSAPDIGSGLFLSVVQGRFFFYFT